MGLNKSLYWFLNFEYRPLMSCRLCDFPRVKVKTCGRNYIYLLEFAAKLLGDPPCSY